MDIYLVRNEITFCWNENKAIQNAKKHNGITFEQATEAFFDPFLVVIDASRNDEAREAIIGIDQKWEFLYVVYIERYDNVIRIISARLATNQEREYYEN